MKNLDKIAERLANLTRLEAEELLKILKEDYNIKSMESIIVGQSIIEESKEVEQTEFDVYLKEAGGRKLYIVKEIKKLTRLSLKDSKNLVDSAPCVICSVSSKEEAESLQTDLENLGATVEVR